MKNSTKIKDLTRLFLGLQEEARAGQSRGSVDVRVHLDQAAADLSTYFENPDTLPTALGAGGLRYEYAFLQHNRSELWIDEALRTTLAEFRSARNVDASRCFQTWGNWFEAIDRAIRNTASVAFLQYELENLSPEFTAKSILRDVGDILEGSLQPLARLRLDMQGVAGIRVVGAPPVSSMSFGKVIEELASRPHSGDIYRPQPFGLTVSQWRNISNHDSYEVRGSEVICTYGSRGHQRTIRFPVNDLFDLGNYINNLVFTHKIAFELFSIDNMSALSRYVPHVDITDHTVNGALAYGLVAAGFSIKSVGYGAEGDYGSKQWALFLVDDYNRSKLEAKAALQDAVSTCLLLAGSINVVAFVRSNTSVYEFSFKGKIGNKTGDTLTGSWDVRALDQYFRPIPQDESSGNP
jgi:hypothetical protein